MINLYNFGHVAKKSFTLKRASVAARIFSVASTVLFTIVSAAALIFLYIMGVLPLKYIASITVVLIALAAIGVLMFFISRKHKIPAVIYGVVMVILSVFICLGLGYLIKTRDFFGKTKAREYYVVSYSVLVLNDSSYQTLEDLNNKKNASYIDTVSSYTEAFEEIKQKISFDTILKDTYIDAANALTRHEADFILLSTNYLAMLDELDEGFASKVRSVYDLEVKIYDTFEISDVDVLNESFNIYISGIDVEGNISTISRSDVNMIMTINPKTHTILLTSIPRDFYVQLHGTTGLKDKLTHSGIYGPTMTVKTVEDFLGININYFIRVNFSSVVNLVNAIGGVYITPDLTFYRAYDGNDCYYTENVARLYNGACALRYARERKAYGTGDIHRVQNQQQVMTAIIGKLTSSEILKNYSNILSAVEDNFETNIPEQKFYQLLNYQLDTSPRWKIDNYHMEGYDSHNQVYSYGIREAGDYGYNYYYVMEPNYDTVEAAKAKIKEVFDGE